MRGVRVRVRVGQTDGVANCSSVREACTTWHSLGEMRTRRKVRGALKERGRKGEGRRRAPGKPTPDFFHTHTHAQAHMHTRTHTHTHTCTHART